MSIKSVKMELDIDLEMLHHQKEEMILMRETDPLAGRREILSGVIHLLDAIGDLLEEVDE
jgi:hypothetical protein